MKKKSGKVFALVFSLVLTAFTGFALLDVFVIPHRYVVVERTARSSEQIQSANTQNNEEKQDNGAQSSEAEQTAGVQSGEAEQAAAAKSSKTENAPAAEETDEGDIVEQTQKTRSPGGNGRKHRSSSSGSSSSERSSSGKGRPGSHSSLSGSEADETDTVFADTSEGDVRTYSDENVTITLRTERIEDTDIYVADIELSSADQLKTAFAEDTYGRNVKAATSDIAESNGAVLAINGDFYGARSSGYVIRNGVLYRSDGSSGTQALAVMEDGSFQIVDEGEVTAEELLEQGAVQVFSFGPALVEDSLVCVDEDEETGKAMASNPRTAIGIIDDLHYVFVVADGRTDESDGLSLHELADYMQSLGVETAYNLDGGGSSTLYFQGEVINQPTTGGSSIQERSVSDIVYIGA